MFASPLDILCQVAAAEPVPTSSANNATSVPTPQQHHLENQQRERKREREQLYSRSATDESSVAAGIVVVSDEDGREGNDRAEGKVKRDESLREREPEPMEVSQSSGALGPAASPAVGYIGPGVSGGAVPVPIPSGQLHTAQHVRVDRLSSSAPSHPHFYSSLPSHSELHPRQQQHQPSSHSPSAYHSPIYAPQLAHTVQLAPFHAGHHHVVSHLHHHHHHFQHQAFPSQIQSPNHHHLHHFHHQQQQPQQQPQPQQQQPQQQQQQQQQQQPQQQQQQQQPQQPQLGSSPDPRVSSSSPFDPMILATSPSSTVVVPSFALPPQHALKHSPKPLPSTKINNNNNNNNNNSSSPPSSTIATGCTNTATNQPNTANNNKNKNNKIDNQNDNQTDNQNNVAPTSMATHMCTSTTAIHSQFPPSQRALFSPLSPRVLSDDRCDKPRVSCTEDVTMTNAQQSQEKPKQPQQQSFTMQSSAPWSPSAISPLSPSSTIHHASPLSTPTGTGAGTGPVIGSVHVSSWTSAALPPVPSPSINIPTAPSKVGVDRLVGPPDARSAPSHFPFPAATYSPPRPSPLTNGLPPTMPIPMPPPNTISPRSRQQTQYQRHGTAATGASASSGRHGMNGGPFGQPHAVHPFAVSAPSGPTSPLKTGPARPAKTSGRRDSYTRFTAEEEAMLLDGVRVYGMGNWKKILNHYQFHWKRTAVDLKDKYRNMTRAKLRKMNAASTSDLSSSASADDGNFMAVVAKREGH